LSLIKQAFSEDQSVLANSFCRQLKNETRLPVLDLTAPKEKLRLLSLVKSLITATTKSAFLKLPPEKF